MIRVLFVLLGIILVITLLYFGISFGIKYTVGFGQFLSRLFKFKKLNFDLFSVVNEVKDHDATQRIKYDHKIKFHAPSLLEFDFYNAEYELLNGLGYTCDLPMEKRYLNLNTSGEIGKMIFFTNEISDAFTEESTESIPKEYQRPLNVFCLERRFLDFHDKVFRRFIKILTNDVLGKLDRKELEKYQHFCSKSISGWITPNSALQGYSYGVNLMNVLYGAAQNKTIPKANSAIIFETSKRPRIDVYSQVVHAAIKYAIVIKQNNSTLYDAMVKAESLDFPEADGLFDKINFYSNSFSNFCSSDRFSSCNCPQLRYLYNHVGLNKVEVMRNAEDDLKLVHEKLQRILKSTSDAPSVLSLSRILKEYSAGELAWLKGTLSLFLYEVCNSFQVHLANDEAGLIKSVHAMKKELICNYPDTKVQDKPSSNDDRSENLNKKCIPQEIVNWLWKADITIEDIYIKSKEYAKYSKLLLYPMLVRIKDAGEMMKLEPQKFHLNLFGTNSEILEYFLSAMDIIMHEKEKSALPPPTSLNWSFSLIKDELFFSLFVDDKDVTEKLLFCQPTAVINRKCRFADFTNYLTSNKGFWRHFDGNLFGPENISDYERYSRVCV